MNMTKAITTFEKVLMENSTANLHRRQLNLIMQGESIVRRYAIEFSVLVASIQNILWTRKVLRTLGNLRRSVLLSGGTDGEIPSGERDQFADIARRLHKCHKQNEIAYRRNVHFYEEELDPVIRKFSRGTRYILRMRIELDERFLREEEDLAETLALIASNDFIESVRHTLAHHDGQTS